MLMYQCTPETIPKSHRKNVDILAKSTLSYSKVESVDVSKKPETTSGKPVKKADVSKKSNSSYTKIECWCINTNLKDWLFYYSVSF